MSPPQDETWEWNGVVWRQATPTLRPPGRAFFAMVYDSRRRRIVVYGGEAMFGFLADTWEWDGTSWRQFVGTTPGTRFNHSMAFDEARGVTVLFGGMPSQQVPPIFLGDTWIYDGATWRQMQPASSPPGRIPGGMTYDKKRRKVVLCLGSSGTLPFNDFWEWDGATWTQLPLFSWPPPRGGFEVEYDDNRERIVLYGGGAPMARNDTWELEGASWVQRFPSSNPPGLEGYAMAFDSRRTRTVLFGGSDGSVNGTRNETWEYAPVNPGSYSSYAPGCPGSTFGVPSLRADVGAPYVASPFDLEIVNLIPLMPGVLAFGASRTSIDLTFLGMPGCVLAASWDVPLVGIADGNGIRKLPFAIPSNPSLIGQKFYNQALTMDLLANARGVVLSNASEGILGEK
jgi:hypothetical protein